MKNPAAQVFGVPLHGVTRAQAAAQLRQWAVAGAAKGGVLVTTPNPEILLQAQQSPKFLAILRSSALNLCDGTGALWAAWALQKPATVRPRWLPPFVWRIVRAGWAFASVALFVLLKKSGPLPQRVCGSDLVQDLLQNPGNAKIFLLGAAEGVAAQLARQWPAAVVGAHSGSPHQADAPDTIQKVRRSGANLILVAFGAPAQEMWLQQHLPKLGVGVGMGVGGAFDFVSGRVRRAPRWMRECGLEWLFRLATEPKKRLYRVARAAIIFPLAVAARRFPTGGPHQLK